MLWLVYVIPANLEFLNPLSDALSDFEVTDLIFSRLRTETAPADTNIVLVNIANLPLDLIAGQIELIGKQKPAVIGIDVLFNSPVRDSAQDATLAQVIRAQTCPMVLACSLANYNQNENQFNEMVYPVEPFKSIGNAGFVNLITEGDNTIFTCRQFMAQTKVNGKETLPFSLMIAKEKYPEQLAAFLARKPEIELVNFKRNLENYYVIDASDLFNKRVDVSFKGKIVLLGYMGSYLGDQSWNDKFYTPMISRYAGKTVPDMFGVVIHANIVSMIAEMDYLQEAPEWVNRLLSVIILIANIYLFLLVYGYKDRYYDLITKLVQFLQVIFYLYLSVMFFYLYGYKVDITLAVGALIISGDMLEVYAGLFNLASSTYHKRFTPTQELISLQDQIVK